MVNCDHHHCIDDVCKLLKLPKISVIQFVVFWVVPYSLLYLGIKEVTCGHLKKKVFKSQLTLGIRVTRFHALFHALLSVNASPCLLIGIFSAYTVFENHRKSLIQHCERSELRLHFEWTKVNGKCQKWSILVSF